jgi:hypothetical protein
MARPTSTTAGFSAISVWPTEKQAVLDFQTRNALEGYRRLTYMMIDADVVWVSPSIVFRLSHNAGRLCRFPRSPSKKGSGFEQSLAARDHWQIDIAHVNIGGTSHYLRAVLGAAAGRAARPDAVSRGGGRDRFPAEDRRAVRR